MCPLHDSSAANSRGSCSQHAPHSTSPSPYPIISFPEKYGVSSMRLRGFQDNVAIPEASPRLGLCIWGRGRMGDPNVAEPPSGVVFSPHPRVKTFRRGRRGRRMGASIYVTKQSHFFGWPALRVSMHLVWRTALLRLLLAVACHPALKVEATSHRVLAWLSGRICFHWRRLCRSNIVFLATHTHTNHTGIDCEMIKKPSHPHSGIHRTSSERSGA